MSAFCPDRRFMPKTINEALKIMEEHQGKALFLAGGTYFHELRERGLLDWGESHSGLQALGLNYIQNNREGIKVGAMAAVNDIISRDIFRTKGFETLNSGEGARAAIMKAQSCALSLTTP